MGFLSVIEIKRSELILVYSNAVMWTKTSICALLKFNLDKIFHQLTGESFIRYILVYSHRALSPLIAGIMASTRAVSSAVSVWPFEAVSQLLVVQEYDISGQEVTHDWTWKRRGTRQGGCGVASRGVGGQGPACRYFKNVAASASAGRNGRQQVRGTSTSVHILIISFHLRTTDTAHATRQRLTRTYCKNHKSCSTVWGFTVK